MEVRVATVQEETIRISRSYRAFHLPRLAAGVGMSVGTYIWLGVMVCFTMTDSILLWIIFPCIGLVVHTMLAWFFKHDQHLFEAYALHVETQDVYDVGSSPAAMGYTPFVRSAGLGKGMSC